MQGLEHLLAEGIIDEVHHRLKTGKEAEVFLVTHKGEVVAAKVYKERAFRSFKNDASYTEGRSVRNSRTQRAMNNGSRFGRAKAEEAWKQAEADALFKLHAAGARVPKPVLFYEGVLLMEAVPDANGQPAPRLIDAPIAKEQAAALYETLRAQVVMLLCADLIHGDLSPYNVLLGWDGPVIIDFPQVIAAARNNRAEQFFTRDLENLRRFFAQLDPALNGRGGDAQEIWHAYVTRELAPGFVPTGRAPQRPPQQAGGFREQRQSGGGGGGGFRGERGPRNGGPNNGGQGNRGGNANGASGPNRGDGRGPRGSAPRGGGTPQSAGGPNGGNGGQRNDGRGNPRNAGGPNGFSGGQRNDGRGNPRNAGGPNGLNGGQRDDGRGPRASAPRGGGNAPNAGGPNGFNGGSRNDSRGPRASAPRGGGNAQNAGGPNGSNGQRNEGRGPRAGGNPQNPSGGRGGQHGPRGPRGPVVEYRGGGGSGGGGRHR